MDTEALGDPAARVMRVRAKVSCVHLVVAFMALIWQATERTFLERAITVPRCVARGRLL